MFHLESFSWASFSHISWAPGDESGVPPEELAPIYRAPVYGHPGQIADLSTRRPAKARVSRGRRGPKRAPQYLPTVTRRSRRDELLLLSAIF